MGRSPIGLSNNGKIDKLTQTSARFGPSGFETEHYRCSHCYGIVNGKEAVPDGYTKMAHRRCMRKKAA